jgi:hypothetical protein
MLKLARGRNGRRGRAAVAEQELISKNLDQLAAQLEQLARLASELPGDAGAVADDEDFSRQLTRLRIDLLGAQALAVRAAAAEPTDEQDSEALWRAVAIRNAEIRSTAAGLLISTLGYQALPNPDPLLIDNEGPIGHHQALELMRSLAGYFGADGEAQMADEIGDNWGDGGFADRDAIARRIFTATFGGP